MLLIQLNAKSGELAPEMKFCDENLAASDYGALCELNMLGYEIRLVEGGMAKGHVLFGDVGEKAS